ncbi:hypothetical protein BT96DRAFT_833182 [Gymnopus androsaceus JB14]|uniref:DUF202 domain-containing protein n=1 Tax=Gymnopus androsaceus JB14 TaxID=1447944 RepID=A0A6A4H0B5_9AGAR|nr:hypothetical protein BT96DRAFT_833182 [Gymnopus androsaceus JB14]
MDTIAEHDGQISPLPANSNGSVSSPSPGGEWEEKRQPLKRRSRPEKFNPTLILENSGSVARDHLASERTFLAYVRTSLAIASTGVALVQLLTMSVSASASGSLAKPTSREVRNYAKPLGATMVLFSVAVLIIGLTRYFSIQHALTLNQFPVARVLIIAASLVLLILVIITFTILVSV